MTSCLKRNILVALACALTTAVGIRPVNAHSGGGSSGGGHGGGGHGAANGNTATNAWSAPSTGHMSGTSRGGPSGNNTVSYSHATGDAAIGKFVHPGAGQTNTAKAAKQRQVASGYVPTNLATNDDWRKRHRYHRPYPH